MQTKDPFTPQEKRILSFIEKGLASKQIAGALNIKKETVDRHRKNMLRKTETHNSVQLIVYALKNGVILMLQLALCAPVGALQDLSFSTAFPYGI